MIEEILEEILTEITEIELLLNHSKAKLEHLIEQQEDEYDELD